MKISRHERKFALRLTDSVRNRADLSVRGFETNPKSVPRFLSVFSFCFASREALPVLSVEEFQRAWKFENVLSRRQYERGSRGEKNREKIRCIVVGIDYRFGRNNAQWRTAMRSHDWLQPSDRSVIMIIGGSIARSDFCEKGFHSGRERERREISMEISLFDTSIRIED